MARGIHLKELRSTDLEAIGVPNDGLSGVAQGEKSRLSSLLADADPVLSRALDDVRQGLETTLKYLDEALAATTSAAQGPPRAPKE